MTPVKPSQLVTLLKTLATPQSRPIFLWGKPGIGKSSLVKSFAKSVGYEVIDVRAVLLDPVDFRGVPRFTVDANGRARTEWAAPCWLPTEGKKVLFLDELPQSPPQVQAACLQLALDRQVGEAKLGDDVIVIAAGNRLTDRAGGFRLSSALANRFRHILLEPDLDEWAAWYLEQGLPAAVVGFLRFRPSLFACDPPASPDAVAYPTPRSWESVGRTIAAMGVSSDLLEVAVAGDVGAGAAAEFCGWIGENTSIDIEAFLSGKDINVDLNKPSVCWALVALAVDTARKVKGDKAKVHRLAELLSVLQPEYGALFLRDVGQVCPSLFLAPAAQKWSKEHGKLLK